MNTFSFYTEQLKQYKATFGHVYPYREQLSYKGLHSWMLQIRKEKDILTEDQKTVLSSLGFEWDASRARWMEFFLALSALKRERGSFYIGKHEYSLRPLQYWMMNIRTSNRRGTIPSRYLDLLKSIDFPFTAMPKGEYHYLWMKNYKHLKDFYLKNGHCEVPNTKEFRSLYGWIIKQRSPERTLTTSQKELLNTIGFRWSKDIQKKKADQWEKQFEKFCLFAKKHGRFPYSERKSLEEQVLYKWLRHQRKREEKGKLSSVRKKKLLSIGIVFSKDIATKKEEAWEKRYQELKQFYSLHGHSNVYSRYNKSLYTWASRQATYIDTLSKEKRAKLLRLRFEFKPSKQRISVSTKNLLENLKEKSPLISPFELPKL